MIKIIVTSAVTEISLDSRIMSPDNMQLLLQREELYGQIREIDKKLMISSKCNRKGNGDGCREQKNLGKIQG